MLVRFSLAGIFAVLALAIPANADHCVTWSTTWPEVDTSPVHCTEEWMAGEACRGAIYVDNELCQPSCVYSIWPYEESNGIPGLQRQDWVVDATCHGMIVGDGLIW